MNRRRRLQSLLTVFFALFLFVPFASAQQVATTPSAANPVAHVISVVTNNQPANSAAAQASHYVLLVSLDGFRWDYARKYGAPHLLAIAARGAVAAQGMLPSYPSLTFPNHYTLVTGLYPEHHGLVANSFFDPARNAGYKYTDPRTNSDGTWYGGTPLWVLAGQQGMRSACLFWPGSEAEIDGARPTYSVHYDGDVPDVARVDQVIAWLKLPPEQRPHFITLYISEPDHTGHNSGPESPEVAAKVHEVDDVIGDLDAKLAALKLPVDLVVVSDHGMIALHNAWVNLDAYADLSHFRTTGSLLYADSEADAAKAFEQLKKAETTGAETSFKVYRRADVPAELHYDSNARIGDPVVVATGPYEIRGKAIADSKPPQVGGHGFDPRKMPEMKASFYAAGPDIAAGVQLPVFENVDVYPLIAKILGLKPPVMDGSLAPVSGALALK
jgi:alkaline phosphatase D